ncbi:HvfC/BufC N-terminal domain-containing protein [Gimibacter soli]|uniref:DNA-binding domain-containing protein n=1 Tax=Gimibacter soli TaxID=3024400 RepID=A0AAF0BFZ8_9PROT|nr:DNA-binding domain-containing protein [Gimibacter soli]WCL53023.1 DNA-binding domain-containing protein [Gimibacter soli]
MPDLATLQKAMKAEILGAEPEAVIGLAINGHGLDPHARLRIHANTLRLGLIDTLMDRYPSCRAFVGDEFWRAVARAYVKVHAPQSAVLHDYGASMGDFLGGFGPVQTLPYLADLARLEWLIHDIQNRAGDAEARLASAYPVFDLWRAANGYIAPEAVDLAVGRQQVLVAGRSGEVHVELEGEAA